MPAGAPYDALLILSFGGPEHPEEVLPFLENVTRGRNVPRERLLEVAEHYYHFGGKSPINEQNRVLIESVRAELAAHSLNLPIYWGNRNWHPLLPDTVARMTCDGVRRALVFVTSAWGGYSGCRQYRENLLAARRQAGPSAPSFTKLRHFHNHPGFIEPMAERVSEAFERLPQERRAEIRLLFTAHSVPRWMADSPYPRQVREASNLVAQRVGHFLYRQVWQSRSGPPSQPWLEPDILDAIRELKDTQPPGIVLAPIGFLTDHMEVIYDLDTEAKALCQELDIPMARAKTVGGHPRFIRMIRELIEERLEGAPHALPGPGETLERCWEDCCPSPPSRPPVNE